MLDGVAWLLRIITLPLGFALKWLWPVAAPTQPSQQPPVESIIEPATPSAVPAKPPLTVESSAAEGYLSPVQEIIKPATPVKPGWFALPLEILPRPTYWPVVLGIGLTFGGFGLVTTFIFSLVGLVLFILGVIGWIKDMWDEQSL